MDEKENITPETQSDTIDDEWGDIDLSDVKDDGQGMESEAETKEEADHSDASEETEQPTETETKSEEEDKADHSFTLKHLDEVREYSRDEVVALAQKGLDYDRIRQKLSDKEEAEKKNKDIIDFVTELARERNASVEDFMLDYRAAAIAAKEGVGVDAAKERLRMQAREKTLNDRETALNEREAAQQNADSKKENTQKDFALFFKAHPDVKAEDIPREVYQQALSGTPLLTAYTAWENAKLKAELEAERKNRENAEKATGSTSSAGNKPKSDPFEDAWYDGT